MGNQIGDRLRRIRTDRKLSQRQLGRAADVANATISQIESGKLNPTVGMLKKVLDGFPISLGEFFSDTADEQDPVFFRARELTEIADGGVSYRQVGAHLGERSLQLLQERYGPGAGTGRHAMTHKGEECGIIISGCLEVTVGDRSAVLGAGDAYYFNSIEPHRFRNPGNEDCEVISACTPPTF